MGDSMDEEPEVCRKGRGRFKDLWVKSSSEVWTLFHRV